MTKESLLKALGDSESQHVHGLGWVYYDGWNAMHKEAIALVKEHLPEEEGKTKEMESALIDAGTILNAIRAQDGTWRYFDSEWFSNVVERIHELLGGSILRAQWKRDYPTPAKPGESEGV